MPTLKKVPWLSIALLLATYSTLGWLLSAYHNPWFVWVIVVVGILLLAAALSSPREKFKDSPRCLSQTLKLSFMLL
jgi:4-hydroxybenzoate polyprenyltransferase